MQKDTNQRPRVAFFIDAWRPGSGTENQLVGLLGNLCPDHVSAELFTLHKPIATEYRHLFPCPVTSLNVGKLLSFASFLKFPRIVARLRRENFAVAMIFFIDTNLFMVPACRLAGIPAIVINRRDMGYWYEPGLLRKLNLVNRWATHFLTNAEAVKRQVVTHEGVVAERISVIPNGIWDEGHRQRLRSAAPAGLAGIPAEAPVVGITASLRSVKRIDRFLEMAAMVLRRVPATHFVIAGQGALREILGAQAESLGITNRVSFLGQVSDVPALLSRLQIGVLTSESEGLSNSLVEYGLAGVPAATFAVGGNDEVVREGDTGFLVAPGDVEALADRVVLLLDDSELRARMSGAAREYCESRFSPERVRNLTLDYFTGLSNSSENES